MLDINEMTLDVSQNIQVGAALGDTWAALICRLSQENSSPDNKPMPMVLEQWPGGRWFRDLGTGQGHLWGFVQVIKPPTLIEVNGPMFMSYPASGHLQVRLTQVAGGTEITLRHRVLGMIEDVHRENTDRGWAHYLNQVKQLAESGTNVE